MLPHVAWWFQLKNVYKRMIEVHPNILLQKTKTARSELKMSTFVEPRGLFRAETIQPKASNLRFGSFSGTRCSSSSLLRSLGIHISSQRASAEAPHVAISALHVPELLVVVPHRTQTPQRKPCRSPFESRGQSKKQLLQRDSDRDSRNGIWT